MNMKEFEDLADENFSEKAKQLARKAPLCNMCGLSCVLEDPDNHCGESYGLINQRVVGGYCSTPGNGYGALDDLMGYEFSLCEFCLDNLFCYMKIPPKAGYVSLKHDIEDTNPYHDDFDRIITFQPATRRINDSWRKMKEFFLERI